MKIAVAGTGYVGLVTGVCLAEKGHHVTCVDIDDEKVKMMEAGVSPIYEEDLEAMMIKNYRAGRLLFTTEYREAYEQAEVIMIGVGTPENPDGSANLAYVYEVAKQIAESLCQDCIIVIKSTVPIGTNKLVEAYIKDHLKNNVSVEVASNPEFLSQGTAVKDTLHAHRIVIGTVSQSTTEKLENMYEPFSIPIVAVSRESAEMIKYASNDFLALKISYMNDIANLCEKVGANVDEVAKGMGYDPRIGNKFLKAGCGYGGSCFPKDTKALHYLAGQNGYELKTVKAAIEVNRYQKTILLEKAHQVYQSFDGKKVAVLGLTFKPGTDDLREAPAIACIELLLKENAVVKAYDPVGMPNFKKKFPNEIQYASSAYEALADACICFIFTEWKEFKDMEPQIFKKYMKKAVVADGRNLFDIKTMDEQGITYLSIGR